MRLLVSRRLFAGHEGGDVVVEEFLVCRAGAGAGGVAPERGDGQEGAMRDELRFLLGVFHGEIQVGCGWHVEHRHFDGAQRGFDVAVEPRRVADIVALPGAHLQNEIVSVGCREEVRAEVSIACCEGGAGRRIRCSIIPCATIPANRASRAHTMRRRLMPLAGCVGVIAAVEGRVGLDGGDLAFQADDAVAIGFGGAGGGDDAVHEIGIADGPLEGLLRAHGKADDGAQMLDCAALR